MRKILKTPSDLPRELRQEDRRQLDDAVLELIGVSDSRKRGQLLDELYRTTSEYYRYQRTQDIQAMEDRSSAGQSRFSPLDLAASIWDSLADDVKGKPIQDWIKARWTDAVTVQIPDGKASALGAGDMFDPAAVTFRQGGSSENRSYANPEQATLVAELANREIRGKVNVPKSPADCKTCLKELRTRIDIVGKHFAELSASRTGQEPMQQKIAMILMQWYIHGRG